MSPPIDTEISYRKVLWKPANICRASVTSEIYLNLVWQLGNVQVAHAFIGLATVWTWLSTIGNAFKINRPMCCLHSRRFLLWHEFIVGTFRKNEKWRTVVIRRTCALARDNKEILLVRTCFDRRPLNVKTVIKRHADRFMATVLCLDVYLVFTAAEWLYYVSYWINQGDFCKVQGYEV